MHMTIRYRKKGKISAALQERVEKKFEYLRQHVEEDHPVHLMLSKEKDGEHAEVSLHFHGHDIVYKAVAKTLYESIDEAAEHAKRQLEKIVKKMKLGKGKPSIRGSEEIEAV